MNGVLGVNYYGEVMTIELISTLLRRGEYARHRSLLTRQLLDETRHANITRRLLLERGRDPLVEDSPADFTFSKLFVEFSARGGDHVLAFLAENENVSSRNFSALIRIAEKAHDSQVMSLYSEILNDEVQHSQSLIAALPADDLDLTRTRDEARASMKTLFNLRYMKLFYGPWAA